MAVGTGRMLCAALVLMFDCGAVANGISNESTAVLDQRLAELERMVAVQQEEIGCLHARIQEQDKFIALRRGSATARRLTNDLKPSIHGASNSTRAYTTTEELVITLDHMWLILCGTLVMFMQAGFAMLEAGFCRAKNVQNVLLKNITDVCVGTLGWWICGWAFAYGGPYDEDGYKTNPFLGTEGHAGLGFLEHRSDGLLEPTHQMAKWFSQWAFCSIASTIVSGGVAERVNFLGYSVFSFAMSGFIFPVVVGWTWGNGWLANMNSVGYMDFAGSGIVHMTGGVGALVGSIIVGPRDGVWENTDAFDPHSLPLVVLGTFILWFGWYGFTCGSTFEMHSAENGAMAAQVAMNTTIAASTSGIAVFVIRFAQLRKYDLGGFCNGILAGLVSITASCSNVEYGSAIAIAIVGALIFEAASLSRMKMKIDDPLDAFAVHGACGAWGTLSAALFDWGKDFDQYNGWSGFKCTAGPDGGCGTGLGTAGIVANLVEVVVIAAWVSFFSTLVFAPLQYWGWLRPSDLTEFEGYDEANHSPPKAYNYPASTLTA